jgi:hypothetical protein
MAGEADVVRFGIENTEFLDWYYGFHHMFESGVHPAMVVLCLSLGQTVSTRTLGDYSARHLFGTSDLLPVAHDAGMDTTRTSELVFAHWSDFYASRAGIRNFVLNVTDPSYAYAIHDIMNHIAAPLPADDVVLGTARTRLEAIQQLCSRYGVPLVLLIPPALNRYNDLLATAAQQQGVNYDYPIPAGKLGPEFFLADRTHLNPSGAVLFTEAIRSSLHTRLRNETPLVVHANGSSFR